MPVSASGEKLVRSSMNMPDFIVPIDVVEREGDETELVGIFRLELLADSRLRSVDALRFAKKARLQAG